VIVGQVGEAEGAPSVRTVANRAVGSEQALTDAASLFVTCHIGNRHVAVLGVDRLEAGFGALYFTLVLIYLGPAQHAGELAHARIQDQVDDSEHQGGDEQHEPPAGQGVVILFDAVIGMAHGLGGLVRLRALARWKQQPSDHHKEVNGTYNEVPAPEITHFLYSGYLSARALASIYRRRRREAGLPHRSPSSC